MAQPSTRQELIDYCKRKLGAPQINNGLYNTIRLGQRFGNENSYENKKCSYVSSAK